MMPSEWAIATARALAYGMQQHIAIAEALDAARAQGRREGRREGLEEAAQVADGHAEHGEFWHAGRYDCAEYIAREIRARIA